MDTNPAITPEVNQNSSAPIQSFQSTLSNPNPSPIKSKFSIKWIIILLIFLGLIAAAGAGGYFLASNQNKDTSPIPTPTISASTDGEQVACTMDAKECPDGSFVSRQGPKCEFAECPTTSSSADTSDWKTFTSGKYGFSIKYGPDDLLGGGAPGVSINEYPNITINDGQPSQNSQWLTVEALDAELNKSVPAIYNAYKLDLKSYVEEVRIIIENESKKNPNIKLGQLEETSIDGQKAYKFSLSGAYKDHSGGFALNEENTFVFMTGLTEMKFAIYYPTTNKHLDKVFSTFTIKFTN